MTDREKLTALRAEIERRISSINNREHKIPADKVAVIQLEAVLSLYDSMKEEPLSKDLNDATNNYVLNVRKGYPRVMDETDRYICNAFKAGAQWQKNQGYTKTETVNEIPISYSTKKFLGVCVFTKYAPFDSFFRNCKQGDKVIVQIMKKEDRL